jgi:two-component system, NtrC family, sensor histidine kinase HydH
VSIEASLVDSEWVLQVRDTGCGIGEEDLAQVFMPFFTTKEKGTGLGLAASQKTVEAHGGSIRVDSTVNEGTTVSVSLPKGV